MEAWLEAIIFGVIQGLTEFLPVSSSGHLEIAKFIFGDGAIKDQGMFFTVLVHFATACSTIVVFRKEIGTIFKGLFEFKNNESFKYSVKIVLSMIPAALVGVFFEDEIDALFKGNLLLVASMLLITAVLLYLADKAKNTNKEVSNSNALVVGVAQAIAILPGISRSGATISTSVLLGIDKTKAAAFSFLMVVPLIFGKIAKDLLSDDFIIPKDTGMLMVLAFVSAFVSGIIACKWMIKLVRRAQLKYFSIYCLVVAFIAMTYYFFN